MIEKKLLEAYAIRKETNFRNVAREYLQHLFLSYFYKKEGCGNFLFKGGTALKLVFGSPRFSEDLDFSGIKNSVNFEKILENVLLDFSFENLKFDLLESKATTGGHLAILKINLWGEEFELHQEVSFRSKESINKELVIVTPEMTPPYRIYTLDSKTIVSEKINALIARQKPRDFFDLYFVLRKEELRSMLKLGREERKAILSRLNNQDKKLLSYELKGLLPRSFWPIIKDLPQVLKKELERN